jgi:CheY-like chemotaxis protein/two-component sensor histidine kinase
MSAQEDLRFDLLLATVGHELRNPLAALDLELRLLQDGAEDVDSIHTRMESQLERLTGFANDLLEMSRITYGKLELRKRPTDLVDVVRSAVAGIASDVRDKKQKLRLCLPETLRLDGDPARLVQVVSNVVTNASRYTPERGEIEVRAWSECGEIVLTVRDTGQGLRLDQLEKVFDRFVQDDSTRGGLGIGLALVRALVELHGGSVFGESDGAGLGSLFTVRLPVGNVANAAPEATRRRCIPHLSRSIRILVVDDDVEFADSFALLLDRMGAETVCAYSGADGIEKARAWPPQAMLIDLKLSDMMGYEVARSVRSFPEGTGILLVAVTGLSDETSGERARCAGFDHRVVKPIDAGILRDLLEAEPVGEDSPSGASDATRVPRPPATRVAHPGR